MPTTFDSGFSDWSPDRLPDLTGKRYFITGANAGLGLEAAKMLRAKNADVYVGARNEGRGKAAANNVADVSGSGAVEFVNIDLASKSSIDDASSAVRALAADGLDGIINNAGVMQPPEGKTADGFELQFGTNHLGHFYMNHLLFDMVVARSGRIVPVSSIAHKPPAKLNFDNIMFNGNYSPTLAYGQSKLANLVYGLELHRRLEAAESSVASISCHPGYSATNLQSSGPTGVWKAVYKLSNALLAQPAARGAQPLVLAAAGVEVLAGGYYGPVSFGGARGKISDSDIGGTIAMDPEAGRKLWELSEQLLDITWTI